MKDQLANERQLIVEGKPGSGTLMSNLVRASAEVSNNGNGQNTQSNLQSKPSKGLSINEILGNIFVFNFAGHDTTATALNYSMLLLTCHPQVQDWIYEELDYQLSGTDHNAWKYDETFLKLKRCLAVLVRRPIIWNYRRLLNSRAARNLTTLQPSAGHSQIHRHPKPKPSGP